jgi:hypothetical protein
VDLGTEATGAYCNDDRDCDPSDACDPSTGLCVAVDTSLDGTIAVGAACEWDAECDPGDFCDHSTGDCTADSYTAASEDTGAPCDIDADCSSDYCDIDTGTCV